MTLDPCSLLLFISSCSDIFPCQYSFFFFLPWWLFSPVLFSLDLLVIPVAVLHSSIFLMLDLLKRILIEPMKQRLALKKFLTETEIFSGSLNLFGNRKKTRYCIHKYLCSWCYFQKLAQVSIFEAISSLYKQLKRFDVSLIKSISVKWLIVLLCLLFIFVLLWCSFQDMPVLSPSCCIMNITVSHLVNFSHVVDSVIALNMAQSISSSSVIVTNKTSLSDTLLSPTSIWHEYGNCLFLTSLTNDPNFIFTLRLSQVFRAYLLNCSGLCLVLWFQPD